MNSTLDQLIEILRQESGLYRSLLVVIDREKEAAVRSDVQALNQAGLDKEKLLAEIHMKDKGRARVLAHLAGEQGDAAADLTLSRISQRAAEPQAGTLRRVCQDFLSLLNQVQAANRRNQQIVEHSLQLLRGSFNMLNELTTPNTVYYRTGNIQNAKTTGKCVCSEI